MIVLSSAGVHPRWFTGGCLEAPQTEDGDMVSRFVLAAVVVFATLVGPAHADVTIKSADGTVQITLPNGWREGKPFGPNIKLQAASGRGGLVLIRVASKEDFKDLKSFANVALERLKRNMPDAEPKTEDIQINNKPAIRITIEGTQANGQRRGYLITFFEADGSYVDVMTMAATSVFKTDEPIFAGLANQVKILASPEAAPPAAATAPVQTTPPSASPSGKPPATRPPH